MTSKHLHLVAMLQTQNQFLLRLGTLLKELKDGDEFINQVGAGIDTWHQYLSQPDIGLTVNEANFLIRMADLAQEYPEIETIPYRSWKLIDQRRKSDDLSEVVMSAQTLSYQDLRERMFELKTNNQIERTYTYLVMKRCNETGNLSKVPAIESDEVLEKFSNKIEGNE